MSLKALAAARGITLGCGPVDTSGQLGIYDVYNHVLFDAKFPYVLDPATDPAAAVIANEFNALDLCTWAVGNTDLTHYGKAVRWSAPGVYDFTGCDEAYAWAVANGFEIAISDPAYSGTPPWVVSGGYTPAQLTQLLHDWYQAFYTRYPLAHHTTLCNEMLPHAADDGKGGDPGPSGGQYCIEWWFQHCDIGVPGGRTRLQFIKQVYEWAKSFNPSIEIVMNQWGVEGYGPADPAIYYNWMQQLIATGAPVDGVGVQSHFTGTNLYNGDIYRDTLRLYAGLGLEVYVTEFDIAASSNWLDNQFSLVRAVVNSGVVHRLTFWSIKDPLFYNASGAVWTDYGRGTGNTMTATAAYARVAEAFDITTATAFSAGVATAQDATFSPAPVVSFAAAIGHTPNASYSPAPVLDLAAALGIATDATSAQIAAAISALSLSVAHDSYFAPYPLPRNASLGRRLGYVYGGSTPLSAVGDAVFDAVLALGSDAVETQVADTPMGVGFVLDTDASIAAAGVSEAIFSAALQFGADATAAVVASATMQAMVQLGLDAVTDQVATRAFGQVVRTVFDAVIEGGTLLGDITFTEHFAMRSDAKMRHRRPGVIVPTGGRHATRIVARPRGVKADAPKLHTEGGEPPRWTGA